MDISGSCAIIILLVENQCYVANVGDSRAVLSSNKGKNIKPLSEDHKPSKKNEVLRIMNCGGKIY